MASSASGSGCVYASKPKWRSSRTGDPWMTVCGKKVLMERRLKVMSDTKLNGIDTTLMKAIEPWTLRDFRPGRFRAESSGEWGPMLSISARSTDQVYGSIVWRSWMAVEMLMAEPRWRNNSMTEKGLVAQSWKIETSCQRLGVETAI